jgi:hypothetical protein
MPMRLVVIILALCLFLPHPPKHGVYALAAQQSPFNDLDLVLYNQIVIMRTLATTTQYHGADIKPLNDAIDAATARLRERGKSVP